MGFGGKGSFDRVFRIARMGWGRGCSCSSFELRLEGVVGACHPVTAQPRKSRMEWERLLVARDYRPAYQHSFEGITRKKVARRVSRNP